MNGLEMLADSGPVVGLLVVLAKLAHGLLGKLLGEVQAMRTDLAAHVTQDEQRHEAVTTALQQRWATQPRA